MELHQPSADWQQGGGDGMNAEQAGPREQTLFHRFLLSLVGTVCRFPLPVLILSLLVAGLSLYSFTHYLEYRTQRSDLINPHKQSQERWRQYLTEFGDDDDIVVVVQGKDRRRMQQALDALAAHVERCPDLFDRLFYKVDLRPLRDRALLFLPVNQIQSIQDNLRSMGLLLELGPIGWRSLTLTSLLREARVRLSHLAPGQPLSTADDQFLTQLLGISRSAKALLANPADYRNPWSSLVAQQPQQKDLMAEPQYFFSGDGTLAFLLVRPIKDKGSFTAAQKSIEQMRRIVADTRSGFPDVDFGLTGLPVLETDEMAAAQRDTQLASWLAIAGVTLLFLLVYRGIFYPLLTVTTLLVGTAWAMGWMTWTVGHVNILSATFAVMLVGIGDYGVLWAMRYEQARRLGTDVRSAVLHTVTHVAVGNLTAATTLALAFFAAMLADFQAIGELGWIAGCGVLLCALACFTVLPALLMLFDRRPWGRRRPWSVVKASGESSVVGGGDSTDLDHSPVSTHDLPAQDAWLPWLSERPRWVLAAGLCLIVAVGACAFRVTYDHNLLHLQARGLDSVKWELTLIEHTAGASWHALSYTSTPEEALALKERYEKLPEVSRVVEVASLVPRDQGFKIELLRDIRRRLEHLPERGVRIPHARPNSQEIDGEWSLLLGQLAPLCRDPNQRLLVDLRASLDAFQDQLGRMPADRRTESRLQNFEERMAGSLAEDLYRLRDVATPAGVQEADLPVDLRVRYIGQTGKWLLQVFAKDCLWEFKPLQHFVHQIQKVDPDATGKPFGTVEGLRAMRNGFTWAGFYALVVITLVLAVDFRCLRNTLVALTPLAMGVLLTLGILGLFRMPLNPANMIAFPLILGVGVDNGVHVLHDHLLRRQRGVLTISRAIGRGVLVKALTAMIGFGTLMISSERGLASLGFILLLGVACSMVSALIFLPAVLRLVGAPERAAEAVPQPLREVA
jgi:hopanoid biosynthesis associated RND transporter like protein HpnN